MKRFIISSATILFAAVAFGQTVISGEYGSGLKLAYDSSTKKITGYFEESTGWDEQSKSPRFSCIFYIEGAVIGKKFEVNTFAPNDKKDDLIKGTLEIVSDKKIKIKLPEEHGGCWNVQHFADERVEFNLEKKQNWIQVRFAEVPKAYFHSERNGSKQLKSYIIKGDIVCIEKLDQQWAYCIYLGKKTIKGWIKQADLNKTL